MIEGAVNAAFQAVVTLPLRGPAGQSREIAFVVDTGFDDFLTLPRSVVVELGLVFRGIHRAILADGTRVALNVYHVTVIWDGVARYTTAVAAENTPLLGMSLLEGHDLSVQVRRGGRVLIQPGVER